MRLQRRGNGRPSHDGEGVGSVGTTYAVREGGTGEGDRGDAKKGRARQANSGMGGKMVTTASRWWEGEGYGDDDLLSHDGENVGGAEAG